MTSLSGTARKPAALALLLAWTIPATGWAYSSGPLDGYAGDPPARNYCTSCHTSFALDSGPGNLSLSGLPEVWLPGVTYTLELSLSQPGQSRWGFELTALREDDGRRAGSLSPADPSLVQISVGPQRDYLKHTSAGTFAGQSGGASWELRWAAPEAGSGAAHFYIAGNAANNSGTPLGDYIYGIEYQIPEGGACCAADGGCTVTGQASCTGIWTAGEPCSPHLCGSPADRRSWGGVKATYRESGLSR